jgi:plasmid maintenance system antidote protein VapI
LQQWLGVSAAFWMNLQKRYELDLALESSGEEIVRTVYPRKITSSETGSAASV